MSAKVGSAVELYTSFEPAGGGAVIAAYKGLVIANKVKSRHIFSDISSLMKSCCGGEISGMTTLTSETRHELLAELSDQARSAGANAVVGINFQTNSMFEGTIDMVVYGTAVQVVRDNDGGFNSTH